MMMRHARTILALAVVVALPACISFGSEPPPSLLTLDAEVAPVSGRDVDGDLTGAIVVQQPTVSKKLNTSRVPVQIDATNVAYLTDTAWVEKPDKLIQRLISQTLAGTSNRLVVDPYIAGGRQALTLEGELLEFGVDKQAMEAVMVYEAVLVGNGSTVRKRRFEAREPIAEVEAQPVGEALNAIANSVARDVAQWVN